VGYVSNGTWISSFSVTGQMEQEVFHRWLPVEWNREYLIVGYRSNSTGSYSVWGTGRMERGGLHSAVPVGRYVEVFSVGYRSNGTVRISVWCTGRMEQGESSVFGTDGMEEGEFQYLSPVDFKMEVFCVVYR